MRRSTRQIKLQAVSDSSLSNQEMKVEQSNTAVIPPRSLSSYSHPSVTTPLSAPRQVMVGICLLLSLFFWVLSSLPKYHQYALERSPRPAKPRLRGHQYQTEEAGGISHHPPPPSVYLFSLARPLLWLLQTNNTLLLIGGGLLINLSQTVLASGPGDLD